MVVTKEVQISKQMIGEMIVILGQKKIASFVKRDHRSSCNWLEYYFIGICCLLACHITHILPYMLNITYYFELALPK